MMCCTCTGGLNGTLNYIDYMGVKALRWRETSIPDTWPADFLGQLVLKEYKTLRCVLHVAIFFNIAS